MSNTRPTVGFIGLGRMGNPMSRALAQAGYPLVLHDADPQVAKALAAELNAAAASTPREVGSQAEIVILMLPDSQIVRHVTVEGDDCLATGMDEGGVIVDMSSSDPVETRRLAETLQDRKLSLIDAPVSGGVKKAETGSLAILIGGSEKDIERIYPLLEAMGEKLLQAGPLGAGHTMKALNNFVSAAGLMAASEALRIGQEFGIASETVVDILNASTGRNNSTENKFQQFILSESFGSGFALSLMAKDIGIARDLAESINMSAPLLHECAREWQDADTVMPAGTDHTAFIQYLEGLRQNAKRQQYPNTGKRSE